MNHQCYEARLSIGKYSTKFCSRTKETSNNLFFKSERKTHITLPWTIPKCVLSVLLCVNDLRQITHSNWGATPHSNRWCCLKLPLYLYPRPHVPHTNSFWSTAFLHRLRTISLLLYIIIGVLAPPWILSKFLGPKMKKQSGKLENLCQQVFEN